MTTLSALLQTWGAVGGAILLALSNTLTAVGTYLSVKAASRKTLAEAAKLESDAEDHRSADYEKALNERSARVMDSLEQQIAHLSKLVEAQSRQLSEQSRQMYHMESEIRDLRRALDLKTKEAQIDLPLFSEIRTSSAS